MPTLNPLQFLEQEYPLPVRSNYIPILQTGADLVNAIFDEHPEFYYNALAPNIKGRLFSFAVMLQFTPEIGIFDTANYSTSLTEVNQFKYRVPEIISKDAILHVTKVQSRGSLPATSRYKRRYAFRNSPFCSQTEIDLPNIANCDAQSAFIDGRKYVLLTYGSRNNRSIDFAELVIPDSEFSGIVDNGILNLNDELHRMNIQPKVAHEEKELAKLKAEFRKHWGDIIKDS